MYDYLLVGAGLFNAVFAHEAAKRGKSCLVLEKRDHIGGNVYTSVQEGIIVHRYGAHIFHTSDREIWKYMNALRRFHPFVHSPLANYHGEIYHLPFNMHTFHAMWGVDTPEEAQAIIASQQIRIGHAPSSLEEKALSLVGRDIYEKLVKGYTEKQWGRACADLPAFIIGRLPVRFTWDNNYFSDLYQGIPEGGYTPLVETMLAKSDVRLQTDFLSDTQGYRDLARKTVYTGPLDGFYGYRFGPLAYRTLRFSQQTLPVEDLQGVAVMNFTDRETPYTRRIEHKHFAPGHGKQSRTVVTYEYPMEWQPGDEMYYPINDQENEARAERYRALAAGEEQVFFCGRLGSYRYMDMHNVVKEALLLAKKEFA